MIYGQARKQFRKVGASNIVSIVGANDVIFSESEREDVEKGFLYSMH